MSDVNVGVRWVSGWVGVVWGWKGKETGGGGGGEKRRSGTDWDTRGKRRGV